MAGGNAGNSHAQKGTILLLMKPIYVKMLCWPGRCRLRPLKAPPGGLPRRRIAAICEAEHVMKDRRNKKRKDFREFLPCSLSDIEEIGPKNHSLLRKIEYRNSIDSEGLDSPEKKRRTWQEKVGNECV